MWVSKYVCLPNISEALSLVYGMNNLTDLRKIVESRMRGLCENERRKVPKEKACCAMLS